MHNDPTVPTNIVEEILKEVELVMKSVRREDLQRALRRCCAMLKAAIEESKSNLGEYK